MGRCEQRAECYLLAASTGVEATGRFADLIVHVDLEQSPGIADEEGTTAFDFVLALCEASILQASTERVHELGDHKYVDISFDMPFWRLKGMRQQLPHSKRGGKTEDKVLIAEDLAICSDGK